MVACLVFRSFDNERTEEANRLNRSHRYELQTAHDEQHASLICSDNTSRFRADQIRFERRNRSFNLEGCSCSLLTPFLIIDFSKMYTLCHQPRGERRRDRGPKRKEAESKSDSTRGG